MEKHIQFQLGTLINRIGFQAKLFKMNETTDIEQYNLDI